MREDAGVGAAPTLCPDLCGALRHVAHCRMPQRWSGKCRIHSSTLYPKGVQVRGSRCGDPCCPPRPRSAFPGLSGGGERGGRGSDSREGTGFSQSWVPGSVHSAHVHFLI